ncbi:MAG: arginine repressor [Oscillospiraceae bacterium]|nr:arginine repressor [Oscillospiraceae bacterium]
MKSARHKKILEIISSHDVETQEELLSRLKDAGYPVTQATISRDIKDLRIIKTLSDDGRYRYFCPGSGGLDSTSKFRTLFVDSATSVTAAGNITAVKCHAGMAQAITAALDTMHMEEIVASLAGDDTIFLLCKDDDSARLLARKLNGLIGR